MTPTTSTISSQLAYLDLAASTSPKLENKTSITDKTYQNQTLDSRKIKALSKLNFQTPEDVKLSGERKLKSTATTFIDILFGLINKEFKAYFQGVRDVKNDKIVGYEALARRIKKVSDDDEIIDAFRFINAAESVGLLDKINQVIIANSLKSHASQNVKGFLSFNMSWQFLEKDENISFLIKKLTEYPKREQIRIEVTPYEQPQNKPLLKEHIEQLNILGIRIWLDGFGTDKHTMSQVAGILEDFPEIAGVKIPPPVLNGYFKNKNLHFLDLVTLAKSKNLPVIAVGVEDSDQSNKLKELGINLQQGFYFHRPSINMHSEN